MDLPYSTAKKAVLLPLPIIFGMAFIYDQVNPYVFDHRLGFQNYLVIFSVFVFCIVGLFGIYTWTQSNTPKNAKTYSVETIFDRLFPFVPQWVWIYNILYQLYFLAIILFFPTAGALLEFLFGLTILVLLQCLCFIYFPTRTPTHWRNYTPKNLSEKMLHLTYKLDDDCNCFPSMHCSIASFCTMTMFLATGWWIWIPLGLVGLSCLYTKQHYFLDIPVGILLGVLVHWITFGFLLI